MQTITVATPRGGYDVLAAASAVHEAIEVGASEVALGHVGGGHGALRVAESGQEQSPIAANVIEVWLRSPEQLTSAIIWSYL